MNETITPRLRTDVLLRPFEAFEGDNRFIVAVDDRHFVVSAAVAAVLEESRSHTTLRELATRASKRLGLTITPELAREVLSERVLSVCFHATEQRAGSECPVRHRHRVMGARMLRPVLSWIAPLFTRWAAVALVASLIVTEFFVVSRASAGVAPLLTSSEIVCAMALTVFGALVHEIGHLAACARFGAAHGGIGVGVYGCVPVFYAEVNGAWMLPRLQRAVVDVGGVYLQCGYVLALGVAYLVSGTPAVLEALVWSHFLILHTLNPFFRYDGYWLLTDLFGSHDLSAHFREPSSKARALLVAFVAVALVYLSYAVTVLGGRIGSSAAQVAHLWAAQADVPNGLWRAVGESALLALLAITAIALSFLFARAVVRIGKDSQP